MDPSTDTSNAVTEEQTAYAEKATNDERLAGNEWRPANIDRPPTHDTGRETSDQLQPTDMMTRSITKWYDAMHL